MNTEELKNHLENIERIYEEFLYHELLSKQGKKSATRSEAKKKMFDVLDNFKFYVLDKPALYSLLTAPSGTNTDKAFAWDDIINPRYFSDILEQKIKELKKQLTN